jgi:hypothetical protein
MVGRNGKGAAWSWRRLTLGTACVAGLAVAGYTGSLFLEIGARSNSSRGGRAGATGVAVRLRAAPRGLPARQ